MTSIHNVPRKPSQLSTVILGGPLNGKKFYMPQPESIGMILGRYEEHIVEAFREFIQPGMILYDVGAHVGYHSLIMNQLLNNAGRVYAFEPNPVNFLSLQNNILINECQNIIPINKALSDKTECVKFATFRYSLVGHIETECTPEDGIIQDVDAVSIDDLVFCEGHPAPQIIKIDVEGAENRVVRGLQETVAQFSPVIIAEVRPESFCEISDILGKSGYQSKILDGNWKLETHNVADAVFYRN
jgi:FkbM family methyltransferase